MNIYKILEALKGVEESVMSEIDQYYQEWINSEYAPMDDDSGNDKILMQKAAAFLRGQVNPEHIETYAQEMVRAFDGGLHEAGYPFAGQSVGQKPGDQVRGTEKATKKASGEHPFKGRLVGASESIENECDTSTMSPLEQKLRARWESTKKGLVEYGAVGAVGADGPVPTTNQPAVNPQQQAQKVAQTQTSMNKLKSAGVNIPNVSQAVKSTLKDPATDPADMQDKNVAQGLGQNIEQLISKGDPNDINRLADMIKKSNAGGAR